MPLPVITPGSSTKATPIAVDADLSSSEIPPPPPPNGGLPPPRRPRRLFRKFLIYTTLGVLTFYPLSGFLSTKSETYRDFFTQTIPGGEAVADYADEHWDNIGVGSVSQKAVQGWQKVTGETPAASSQRVQDKAGDVKAGLENAAARAKREAELRAAQAKAGVERGVNKAEAAAERTKAEAKVAAEKAKAGVRDAAERTKAGAKEAAAKTEAAAHDAKVQAQAAGEKIKAGAKDAAAKVESVAHDAKVQAKSAAEKAQAEAVHLKDRLVSATVDAKDRVAAAIPALASNVKEGAQEIAKEAEGAVDKGKAKVSDAVNRAEKKVDHAVDEVQSNVKNSPPTSSNMYPDTQRPRELRPETVTPAKPTFVGQEKYAGPALPIGHEPPPGYYIPPAPKAPAGPAAPTLPLLAPKVADFGTDEPIISQLASTIDSLTSSLSAPGAGPSKDATGILSKAQDDLTVLSKRLAEIKKAEKAKLEKSLGEKTKEFEASLKKAEEGRQASEAGLNEKWIKEKEGLVSDWKKDMDRELESQREGIEKRSVVTPVARRK